MVLNIGFIRTRSLRINTWNTRTLLKAENKNKLINKIKIKEETKINSLDDVVVLRKCKWKFDMDCSDVFYTRLERSEGMELTQTYENNCYKSRIREETSDGGKD